jgi:tRNA(His) guanylyltransferase
MTFDELDERMRIYETGNDTVVPPGMYFIARLDGRSFTRLTKELHDFEKPFDPRFRDYALETVKHLMQTGFNIIYGYTQSDEISLLFHIEENSFARKHRKLISVLAGEASAKFSLQLGSIAVFDCRISELPNRQLVADYFRWRHEDAYRNSLSAYCYWELRKTGATAREATRQLDKMSTSEKDTLLFTLGISYHTLPAWQRRGIGVYWKEITKECFNPITQETVLANRKVLAVEESLPADEEYSRFILSLMAGYNM